MKNNRAKFAVLILCFLFNWLQSQVYKPSVEVTLDPSTGLSDKEAPFDETFILGMPIDSAYRLSDIISISILEGKTRNGEFYLSLDTGNSAKSKYDITYSQIKSGKVKLIVDKTGKDFNMLKINLPPLKPNTSYIPLINLKPDKEIITLLDEINALLYISTATARLEAQNKYLTEAQPKIFSEPENFHFKGKITAGPDWPQYDAIFRQKIRPLMQAVRNSANFNTLQNQLITFSTANNTRMQSALTRLGCCNCSENILYKDKEAILHFQTILRNLSSIASNSTMASQISMGYSQLKTPVCSLNPNAVNWNEFEARMENLNANILALKDVSAVLDELLVLGSAKCNVDDVVLIDLKSDICALLQQFKTVHNFIKTQQKRILAIYQDPANNFAAMRIFYGNNTPRDIKTAGSGYIIPDLGVAFMFPKADNFTRNPIVRPYFGVNIGIFGPINRQTKMRYIPGKCLRHYVSMNIGVTAIPFNKEKREDVQDLMGNFSLIHGISFRPHRIFRISGGYVLYRNPDLNNFQSSGKLTTMPYLSFALDLDIADYFSKLTGKFF